ncbi:MAG: hypothetical protein JW940_04150 [Polyangiaceae bacterium]|nr:hypothetical protein [Polyangiaceae bacterium]
MRLGALVLAGCLCAGAFSAPTAAQSQELESSLASAEGPSPCAAAERVGRPVVKLDRLEFPENVANAAAYVAHLKRVLRREAARADWGAGRGARIEYRFSVTKLTLAHKGDVLAVTCAAVGKLPKGKIARSRISFGGDPNKPRDVVKRVLEIVARGVITRLAELERLRRTGAAG